MDVHRRLLDRLAHVVHARFLGLLIGAYGAAACFPSPGLWIRDCTVGEIAAGGATGRVSLSMLMLALLLLNAGLGAEPGRIRNMLRAPRLLGAGLVANLLVPLGVLYVVTRVMAEWHNDDEVQCILVGLALVASMPIAGSSTAWAQDADGELALSLGLVLGSTMLSQLSTPLALHAVGLLASGEYAYLL